MNEYPNMLKKKYINSKQCLLFQYTQLDSLSKYISLTCNIFQMELKDLNLEVGEDRLVLDSKGVCSVVDFFLPCSVDQAVIEALLNRNNDVSH